MDAIQTFITDFEALLLAIASSVAVIGVLGLGFMYLGSSLPLIGEWKKANPKAFNDVTFGIIFLVVASGGGVAALLA